MIEEIDNNKLNEEQERKKRSHKRLFILFLLIDIFLVGVIIAQIIELIISLTRF